MTDTELKAIAAKIKDGSATDDEKLQFAQGVDGLLDELDEAVGQPNN